MLITLFALFLHIVHVILGIGTPQSFPPPLSTKEETECFLQMEKGDDKAREKLILHNLRLVSHIVRKYYSGAKNAEDLVSIGTIGLVKAVDSFNVKNGAKFATYAAKCIQNEILMNFRSQKKLATEVSINETIDVDRDGNPLTYIDVLCSEDDIVDEVDKRLMTHKMLVCMEQCLTVREKQILKMRFGLDGIEEQTQKEIAQKLNISRSYVSRIEKAALEKLREVLSGK